MTVEQVIRELDAYKWRNPEKRKIIHRRNRDVHTGIGLPVFKSLYRVLDRNQYELHNKEFRR